MKHRSKLLGAFAVLASASLITLATVPANADPARPYASVGSDTIQDVWNALTNDTLAADGTTSAAAYAGSIASYNAFDNNGDAYQIKTKALGNWFVRPSGSGDGVKALSTAWNDAKNHVWTKAPALPAGSISAASCTASPGAGDTSGIAPTCTATNGTYSTTAVSSVLGSRDVDLARSSSGPSGTSTTGDLAYVPFARDAVSIAVKGIANFPALNAAELKALYTGTPVAGDNTVQFTAGGLPEVLGTDSVLYPVQPQIPQIGSGTRKFFLQKIGFTDITSSGTSASLASYIPFANASVAQGGNAENDGTVLKNTGDLEPFSAAQWIAQNNAAPGVANTTDATEVIESLTTNQGGTPAALAAVTGTAPNLVPGPLYGPSSLGKFSALTSNDSGFARDTYDVIPSVYLGASATAKQSFLVNVLKNLSASSVAAPIVKKYGFGILGYGTTSSAWIQIAFTN